MRGEVYPRRHRPESISGGGSTRPIGDQQKDVVNIYDGVSVEVRHARTGSTVGGEHREDIIDIDVTVAIRISGDHRGLEREFD